MNKVLLLSLAVSSVLGASCASAPQVQIQQSNTNTAIVVAKNDNSSLVVSSHSGQTKSTPPANISGSKTDAPVMTGNAQAIDTSEFDAAIAKAEKDFKAKPQDTAAKKTLADAYAERALALTGAAQYRAALGDFRRCLKLDSANTEAKKMHDQIVDIFKSLNREPPKEGEEPPPMPFNKGA
jgi:tetratricopeptide (TPR) repeat protein